MKTDDIQKYVSYKVALASLRNLMTRNDLKLGSSEKSAITMSITIIKDKVDELENVVFGGDDGK